MEILKEFATQMNLVSFTDGQAKPNTLIAYERSMAGKKDVPPAAQANPAPRADGSGRDSNLEQGCLEHRCAHRGIESKCIGGVRDLFALKSLIC